jgi:hypothetical protein
MYESQHRINTSKNMARYKQVVRPHRRSQDHRTPPPFEASRRLFIEEGYDKITLLDISLWARALPKISGKV